MCLDFDKAEDLPSRLHTAGCHGVPVGRQHSCTAAQQVCAAQCLCGEYCGSYSTGSAVLVKEILHLFPWQTGLVGCDRATLPQIPHVVVVLLSWFCSYLPSTYIFFFKRSVFLCYVPNSGFLLTLQIKKK